MVFLSVSRIILMCFSSKIIKNVQFRVVTTNCTYYYIYIYILSIVFRKFLENFFIFLRNAQKFCDFYKKHVKFFCIYLFLFVFLCISSEWRGTNENDWISFIFFQTARLWRWRRIFSLFRRSARHAYRIIVLYT